MTATAPDILIQEVAPRDGLQIEAKWVETSEKIRLINSLSAIGFSRIEVSSFVSAAAVPSLRDAADVFAGIERRPGTIYTALIPNRKGAELALAARADELNFVMSASETHNRANMNMTHAVSLRVAQRDREAGPCRRRVGQRDGCDRVRLSVRRPAAFREGARYRQALSRSRGRWRHARRYHGHGQS
ncbi:hypothetical protein ACVW0J_005814 [Bradyrhizobium sp. i1.7.7]